MYDLVVKNGVIVNVNNKHRGNIYVHNGKIAAITDVNEIYDSKSIIDASEKLVMPGFIDPHSHLNDPGYTESEDFYTGTCSAAAGGISTVLEHPLTFPLPASLEVLKDKKKSRRKRQSLIFAFLALVLPGNFIEVDKMIEMGAVAFKAFIPYSPEIPQLNDGEIMEHMQNLLGKKIVLAIHCENDMLIQTLTRDLERRGMTEPIHYEKSRPKLAEVEATNRIALLAKEYKARVHIVHCSSGEAVDIVSNFKKQGVDITVETCPHFLVFDENDVRKWGVYCIAILRFAIEIQ